jgi:hypothetical protein
MILNQGYLQFLDNLQAHFTDDGDVSLPTQLIKIQEELGEAAAAYIGMTGSNPRKGVTHTDQDVAMELADVVISALLAIKYTGLDLDTVLATQALKTQQRLDEYAQRAKEQQ